MNNIEIRDYKCLYVALKREKKNHVYLIGMSHLNIQIPLPFVFFCFVTSTIINHTFFLWPIV